MSKKIFIGGLPLEMTQDDLKDVLEEYGPLLSIKLISDRDTGKSRGFAFVELDDEKADAAISELNGASIDENRLKVSIANPPSSDNKSGGFNNRSSRPNNGFGDRGGYRNNNGFGGNRSSYGTNDRNNRTRGASRSK